MSSSAYRVASLLQRDGMREEESSLALLSERVKHFMSEAAVAPPVMLETAPNADTHDVEVQLHVVAGVLEARSSQEDLTTLDGVLLPTKGNHSTLDAKKAREAQAMLNLLGALSNHDGPSTAVEDETESSEDDADGVVVMNASDLDSETSSDDSEGGSPRQRKVPGIVELN